MGTPTDITVWNRRERQARFASAFAETQPATSSALLVVLSHVYRRDPDGWTHACRVGQMALRIGEQLDMTARDLEDLERAAWLHDIGRFVLPDPDDHGSQADRSETYRGEQVHAVYEMTRQVPFLHPAVELVVASRECFDGTGVPRGLEREAIPLGARILHLADVSDALASLSWPLDTLNMELVRYAGSRFDPDVVAAWLRCADGAPSVLVPWLSSLERRAGH